MTSPRAVILAGGQGTRLRPYTTVLPKPLMPVGDRPILDVVVRQLRHRGFGRITVATGYLAELIEAFFGDGGRHGVPIDYVREDEPLGTAGALALVDGLDDDFLVMNGDVLTDIDYRELLDHHRENDAIATIATHRRHIEVSLGVLEFGDGSDATRVTDYHEKPEFDYEASMGVYCFSPRVLEFLDPGVRLDFPELILRLIERGEVVRAHHQQCFWLDVGRPEDYAQAQDEFERLRATLIPD